MYHLRVPETAEEMDAYYQFRWKMLCKPLHQPLGSERDAYDALAHHQTVVGEQGQLVAIGRLSINADNEAAICFMAVHPDVRCKGLDTLVAMTLESVVHQEGVKRVVCSTRLTPWRSLPSWAFPCKGRSVHRKPPRASLSDDQTHCFTG